MLFGVDSRHGREKGGRKVEKMKSDFKLSPEREVEIEGIIRTMYRTMYPNVPMPESLAGKCSSGRTQHSGK